MFRVLGRWCPTGRIDAVRAAAYVLALMVFTTQFDNSAVAQTGALPDRNHARDSRIRFRTEMARTISADHPAILPVAAAIRAVSLNPLEQIVMVNDVTHLLVDYDEDQRVYGRTEYHATLDEMIARRGESGWVYLRDDCDGRAVFAAHLLAALNIPWHFEASYWERHAWIVARVGGVDYDLLELRGATSRQKTLSYRLVGRHFVRSTRPAPYFGWRRAWQERTGKNGEIGKCLGLLELNSTDRRLRERIATDWTKTHPEGDVSPFDERMISATFAAFPYRANLHPTSFATNTPRMTRHASGGVSMDESRTFANFR